MTATPESAGAIGFLTLPALYRDLFARMATGQLVAYRGETIKKVFFKSGFILYATSNLTADRLGDVLLARGVITRDQFDESTRQVLATGHKQGTLLVQPAPWRRRTSFTDSSPRCARLSSRSAAGTGEAGASSRGCRLRRKS